MNPSVVESEIQELTFLLNSWRLENLFSFFLPFLIAVIMEKGRGEFFFSILT